MVDYVVLGAGSAGCVLARRLVDAGKSVVLIEAGKLQVRNSMVDELGGVVNLWGSDADWALKTVPQEGLLGRSITINQGKIVGGGGAINAMMYVRCNKADYELLIERSGGKWTAADIEAAFAGLENYVDGPAPGRSQTGLMTVRNCPDPYAQSPEFTAAAVELGYAGGNFDYNGPKQLNGAGPLQFNITEGGKRHGPFNAYLEPILGNPLLTVLAETTATRVIFDGARAVAVEAVDAAGKTARIDFGKDVILALGTLQTPGLLMRSGVGPAADLKAAGVPLVADLPAVGKKLQDHMQLPIIFRLQKDLPAPVILTGNVLFVDLNGNGAPGTPDLQLNFTPAIPGPLARNLPQLGGPAMIFLAILIQPRSVGSITLKPDGGVAIDPGYLSDPADVEVFKKAIGLARSMAKTQALSALAGDELAPSDADLEAYIRGGASTLWHPAGTASLGTDPADSVVGADLAPHGLRGVRVADASVMPRANTGNNHVPALIIAEICASKILAEA